MCEYFWCVYVRVHGMDAWVFSHHSQRETHRRGCMAVYLCVSVREVARLCGRRAWNELRDL